MLMEGGPRARFVADAMLGSLARKLRILGFDTAYYKEGADGGVVRLAREEGRVILTADRALAALALRRGAVSVLLPGRSDADRLRVLRKASARLGLVFIRGRPRCSVCNGELATVPRSRLAGNVAPSVAARHRLFYRCEACAKVYWKGGHWKRLRSYERLLGDA
jgi:uncharacterized protein with PIN domain